MSANGICCRRLWDESLVAFEGLITQRKRDVHTKLKADNDSYNSSLERENISSELASHGESELKIEENRLNASLEEANKYESVEFINVDLTADLLTELV